MDEVLPVTNHHRVYSTIDPASHFKNKSYNGKVVLVTGASRGIGRDIARHYTLAGASVGMVGRYEETLEKARTDILNECPNGQILTKVCDVRDWERVKATVDSTIEHFGRLDILVANAGDSTPLTALLGEKDPVDWWTTFEVNIRGIFNFIRFGIVHLEKVNGYVIGTSSGSAQFRFPRASDYCVSKHAVNRLIEFVVAEYPSVKAFAVHPGVIDTELSRHSGIEFEAPDTTELPAATMLYLTSGKADWLSGKYISSNWDLGEIEVNWKERILAQQGLVNKLNIPDGRIA